MITPQVFDERQTNWALHYYDLTLRNLFMNVKDTLIAK